MTNTDLKNYVVTVMVSFMSGLPFLFMEDVGYILFISDITLIILYILLTCWNSIGDYIIINYVLKGRIIESDAAMLPYIVDFYYSKSQNKDKKCKIYYTQSKIPYFILINPSNIIVSLGTEDRIINYKSDILCSAVPNEVFEKHSQYSRKILLLSLVIIPIVNKLIQLGTTLVFKFAEIVWGLAAVIASGALFGSGEDIVNSFSGGSLIGKILLKINELTSLVQDKIVELIVDFTQSKSFEYAESSNRIDKN